MCKNSIIKVIVNELTVESTHNCIFPTINIQWESSSHLITGDDSLEFYEFILIY